MIIQIKEFLILRQKYMKALSHPALERWIFYLLLLAAVAGISVQHLTQAPRPRLRSWTAAAVRCWR